MRRLGLCPEGGAERFIDDGDNTYGGKFVTNPSGGLLSKGHPLGATGLAQCYELTRQLRGTAASHPGRGRETGAAAQSRPWRRLRRHAVRAGMRPAWSIDPPSGAALTPVTARVEPGRLRYFVDTIGERNPIYRDAEVARTRQAMPRYPSPPTYLFCLEMMDADEPFEFLTELDIDLARILHGEQSFTYHAPVVVGDTRDIQVARHRRHGQEGRRADDGRPRDRGDQSAWRSRRRNGAHRRRAELEGAMNECDEAPSRGGRAHRSQGISADHAHHAGAVLRGVGRPQPDARRSRFRQKGGISGCFHATACW